VGNIVTLRLSDGRVLSERVDYPRGHARNPLADAEVEAKFRNLAEPVLGQARAEAALRRLWQLEKDQPVAGLLPLIEVLPMKHRSD
jgi:2-methylcitrate dehydratase